MHSRIKLDWDNKRISVTDYHDAELLSIMGYHDWYVSLDKYNNLMLTNCYTGEMWRPPIELAIWAKLEKDIIEKEVEKILLEE